MFFFCYMNVLVRSISRNTEQYYTHNRKYMMNSCYENRAHSYNVHTHIQFQNVQVEHINELYV